MAGGGEPPPLDMSEVAGLALLREVQAAFGRYRPAVAVTVANNLIAAVLVAMSDGDEARALVMATRVSRDLRSIVTKKAAMERDRRAILAANDQMSRRNRHAAARGKALS